MLKKSEMLNIERIVDEIALEGVDGIKTGYTRASGFNLVTSMRRGNRHIVGVVLGVVIGVVVAVVLLRCRARVCGRFFARVDLWEVLCRKLVIVMLEVPGGAHAWRLR